MVECVFCEFLIVGNAEPSSYPFGGLAQSWRGNDCPVLTGQRSRPHMNLYLVASKRHIDRGDIPRLRDNEYLAVEPSIFHAHKASPPTRFGEGAFFDSKVFALISIAAMVESFSNLIRRPLNDATLPRLGLLIGQGRLDEARRVQTCAFSTLSLTLLPRLGLLLVGASEIVETVYTPAYLGAAPLMQIYVVGHIVGIFSAGHLLVTLNAGDSRRPSVPSAWRQGRLSLHCS